MDDCSNVELLDRSLDDAVMARYLVQDFQFCNPFDARQLADPVVRAQMADVFARAVSCELALLDAAYGLGRWRHLRTVAQRRPPPTVGRRTTATGSRTSAAVPASPPPPPQAVVAPGTDKGRDWRSC